MYQLSYLKQLEAESIYILREVAAEFENPVMLYSVGKDSSVMVRLAQKAFYPKRIPFPLMHIDTGYKFKEMYSFRDNYIKQIGADLIVYRHPDVGKYNPFKDGIQKCCGVLKTQSLKNAISEGEFDAAIGGARRDEEKSRAKERIYSFRNKYGQWDPKNQRPELWNIFNGKIDKGENIRVFPLSNWTELDIWRYIKEENIPVVPMYFAKERDMILMGKHLIPIESSQFIENPPTPQKIMCRFRTLGCTHCTGAVRSKADTVDKIIEELVSVKLSERITRLIDSDIDASMEIKKREGYF